MIAEIISKPLDLDDATKTFAGDALCQEIYNVVERWYTSKFNQNDPKSMEFAISTSRG